jgi:hypothetical protein
MLEVRNPISLFVCLFVCFIDLYAVADLGIVHMEQGSEKSSIRSNHKALFRSILFRSYLTKLLQIPEVIWREKLMADWSRTATQYCEKDESSLFKKPPQMGPRCINIRITLTCQ